MEDARGATRSFFTVGLGEPNLQLMAAGLQVIREHDGSWVVEVFTEAMIEGDLVPRSAVDAGLQGSGIGTGQDKRSSGGAFESQ